MVSCEFCEISKNTFFTEHLWMAASNYTPWPKQEKSETPLFWVKVTFECYEPAMAFCVFIFIFFCLETTRWRAIGWKRLPSLLCFFSESIIPKVLDHSYVQSSLSTITSQLDNSIWKTPYNWIFYGHRCQACTKTFNLLLYASLSLKQA